MSGVYLVRLKNFEGGKGQGLEFFASQEGEEEGVEEAGEVG